MVVTAVVMNGYSDCCSVVIFKCIRGHGCEGGGVIGGNGGRQEKNHYSQL